MGRHLKNTEALPTSGIIQRGMGRRSILRMGAGIVIGMPFVSSGKGKASERVRLAMIGCGIRAGALIDQLLRVSGVQLVALADPDTASIDELKATLKKQGTEIGKVDDYRDHRIMLERTDIDAVLIASPNHWHALHAVHALAAGKHVYLEKPVCHSLWEAGQLLKAQVRYGRVIAAGLQNRSDVGIKAGFDYLSSGALGKIQHVHVCGFRGRSSIGKQTSPLLPPATCDYNQWLGPAGDLPILRNKLHYDWHWDWNTGNGEMGNQTPHELDLVQWLLGDNELPSTVQSLGGRFAWNDAGTTPNLHLAWYQHGGIPVTVEVNNMTVSRTAKAEPARSGIRVGILVRCEGGELHGGRGGMFAVADDGKTRLEKFPGDAGAGHMANFIDAVRSGSSAHVAAPLHKAVGSAVVSHLANLSYCNGVDASHDAAMNALGNRPDARSALDTFQQQLAAWDMNRPLYRLGKEIALNAKTLTIKGEIPDSILIKRDYRGGFDFPNI